MRARRSRRFALAGPATRSQAAIVAATLDESRSLTTAPIKGNDSSGLRLGRRRTAVDLASGTTFADLQTLSTDYKFEADDSCGGGSPRFQVDVTNGTDTGTIFVYIGPPPAYTLCPPNVWTNTGDLLEGVNPIDTSQLDLGTFYDPCTRPRCSSTAATVVTGVQVVADGGWCLRGRRADRVRRQHEHRRHDLHVRPDEPTGQRTTARTAAGWTS